MLLSSNVVYDNIPPSLTAKIIDIIAIFSMTNT